MTRYSLQTQMLIIVAVVMLHNYITKEAQRDWSVTKRLKDVIVIDCEDGDEDDETLTGFILSHLDNKMNLFRDYLYSLMQTTLDEDMHTTVLCFIG